MASKLTGQITTLPGLICPVDTGFPIVLSLRFNKRLGYYDALLWECTNDPEHHNGVVYPLPSYISAAITKRWTDPTPSIGAT
jgi:hypothetical protein